MFAYMYPLYLAYLRWKRKFHNINKCIHILISTFNTTGLSWFKTTMPFCFEADTIQAPYICLKLLLKHRCIFFLSYFSLSFSYLFNIFILHPELSLPSLLPFPPCPPMMSILFPLHSKIHVSPFEPSMLLSFFVSLDCSMVIFFLYG